MSLLSFFAGEEDWEEARKRKRLTKSWIEEVRMARRRRRKRVEENGRIGFNGGCDDGRRESDEVVKGDWKVQDLMVQKKERKTREGGRAGQLHLLHHSLLCSSPSTHPSDETAPKKLGTHAPYIQLLHNPTPALKTSPVPAMLNFTSRRLTDGRRSNPDDDAMTSEIVDVIDDRRGKREGFVMYRRRKKGEVWCRDGC